LLEVDLTKLPIVALAPEASLNICGTAKGGFLVPLDDGLVLAEAIQTL